MLHRFSPRRGRHRLLAAAVALVLPVALAVPASASASATVLTESIFQFPSGSGNLTDMQEPLYFYQLAPNTNWFQDDWFTNGTSDTASATVSVDGISQNPDGSLSAILIFKVNASGTKVAQVLTGSACNTTATYSQCYTGVTLPAVSPGYPDIDALRLTRSFQDSSTGNYWWSAALVTGSGQTNVGLIEVPGGTTSIDVTTENVLNQTQYVGNASTCSTVPVSNVSWLRPWNHNNAGDFAQYDGSLAANGCHAQFTNLTSGGIPGVNVIAPVAPF